SYDNTFPLETLATLGASAAVHISNIPFNGPVASVTVGRIGNDWILNPSPAQLEQSQCEITVAGTKNGILMVEGESQFISEDQALEALKFAHASLKPLLDMQDEL